MAGQVAARRNTGQGLGVLLFVLLGGLLIGVAIQLILGLVLSGSGGALSQSNVIVSILWPLWAIVAVEAVYARMPPQQRIVPLGTARAIVGFLALIFLWELIARYVFTNALVLVPLSKVPSSLAVSPSGTQLAVPHWEGGLRTWDLAKDRVELQLPGGPVGRVVWSPDGRTLALAGGGALRFVEAASGKEVHPMVGGGAEFSPDGAHVAVSVEAGIEVWKTGTWTRLQATYGGPGTGVWIPESLELSGDGRSLLAGGTLVAKDAPAAGRLSGPVYFWKLRVR